MTGRELVESIIGATLHGDVRRAAALVDELGTAGGDEALYGLSATVVEVAKVLLLAHLPGPAWVRVDCWRRCEEAVNTGGPHEVFAAQFTGACVSDDHDMAEALFKAAAAAGSQTRNDAVTALLAYVAAIYRADPAPPTSHQGETRS